MLIFVCYTKGNPGIWWRFDPATPYSLLLPLPKICQIRHCPLKKSSQAQDILYFKNITSYINDQNRPLRVFIFGLSPPYFICSDFAAILTLTIPDKRGEMSHPLMVLAQSPFSDPISPTNPANVQVVAVVQSASSLSSLNFILPPGFPHSLILLTTIPIGDNNLQQIPLALNAAHALLSPNVSSQDQRARICLLRRLSSIDYDYSL